MSNFELNAKIGANASGFFGTLRKVEQETKGVGLRIQNDLAGALKGGLLGPAAAGLGLGAGLYAAIAGVGDYVKELKHLHENTGIAYRDLQVYEAGAKKHGNTIQDITSMVNKLAVERAKSLSGGVNSEGSAAFQKLGVSFNDLKSKSPAELFKQIQNNLAGMADKTMVADALVHALGRSAKEMGGFFSESFDSMNDRATAQGLVVADETLGDIIANLKVMNDHWKGFKAEVSAPLFSDIIYGLNYMILQATLFKDTLFAGISFAITSAQRLANIVSGGAIGISKEVAESQDKATRDALRTSQNTFDEKKHKMDLGGIPEAPGKIGEATEDGNENSKGGDINSRAKNLVRLEKEIADQREKNLMKGMSESEKHAHLIAKEIELKKKLLELEKTKTPEMPERVKNQNERQKEKAIQAEDNTYLATIKKSDAEKAALAAAMQQAQNRDNPDLSTEDKINADAAVIITQRELKDATYDYNAALKKEKEIKESKTPEQKAFAAAAGEESVKHKGDVAQAQLDLLKTQEQLVSPQKETRTAPDALQRIGGTRGGTDPGASDRKVLVNEVRKAGEGIQTLNNVTRQAFGL